MYLVLTLVLLLQFVLFPSLSY